MNSRGLTVALLVLLILVGLWVSGRAEKIVGAVFGEAKK